MNRREREMAPGEAGIGVSGEGDVPATPETEDDEDGVGDEQDRLGHLVEPDVRTEPAPEQADARRARESQPLPNSFGRAALERCPWLGVVRHDDGNA